MLRWVVAAGLLVASAVPVSGNHAQSDSGRTVAFDHKTGNEWWVEAVLSGPDAAAVASVEAMDTGGAWVPLTLRSWGAWAASFHVEPGHQVRFRATWGDGAQQASCWFTHPAGVEQCTPTPFDAAFTGVRGNEWWIQANVAAAGDALSRVDVRIDGGEWRPLALKSWGAWAASHHAPPGSVVQFRATSASGAADLSGCYAWVPPQGTDAAAGGCGWRPLDPVPWYVGSFWGMKGNEWWAEIRVDEPVTGVDARADGGPWHALTLRSWGAWAGSFHIPPGSLVQFRAQRTDGAMGFHAQGFPWPDQTPPYPGWGNAAWAFDAAFHNVKGDAGRQEVNVYATWNLDGVSISVDGGPWHPMARQSWGDWASTLSIAPGSSVRFMAMGGEGSDTSASIAWPPA